jgi:two-component system chemotaxis response regulator CheB
MTGQSDPPPPTAVLAVGGSAGSLSPLLTLVRGLPEDFAAAVLVTTHLGEARNSRLPELLSRRSHLPADWAKDGEPLEPAKVYVAPPGFHLLASGATVRLSRGPRINRHRPSVDALFASAASAAGPSVVAVVLSGALDDGAVGAALVAAAGGEVLVQDPGSAEFTGMPSAALRAVAEASTTTPDAIAEDAEKAVARAVLRAAEDHSNHPENPEGAETMANDLDIDYLAEGESRLTRMVCPECGGALAQIDLAQISYFRCHVGHHYGPQTLAAAQADASESKLWSAVAALEEEAALQHHLHQASPHSDPAAAEHERLAKEIGHRASQLRELAKAWTPLAEPSEDSP